VLATRVGLLLASLGLIIVLSCGDASEPVGPVQSPVTQLSPVPTADLRPTIEPVTAKLPTSSPTATPTATPLGPDLEATVQALEAQVQALTAYTPTIEDYKIVVMPKISGSTPAVRDAYLGHFDAYAATYVASECVDEKKPSPEAFRAFVRETVFHEEVVKLVSAVAERAVQRMIEIAERHIAAGSSPLERECMRPYVYPVSGAEAALAVGLIGTVSAASLTPAFRIPYKRGLEELVLRWFDPEVGKGKPLILWLCQLPATGNCVAGTE